MILPAYYLGNNLFVGPSEGTVEIGPDCDPFGDYVNHVLSQDRGPLSGLELQCQIGRTELSFIYEATFNGRPCVAKVRNPAELNDTRAIGDTDTIIRNHEKFDREVTMHSQASAAVAATPQRGCILQFEEGSIVAADGHLPVGILVLEDCTDFTPYDRVIFEEGFSQEDVLRVGLNIASALQYVHGKKVVHCDMKPGNVLVKDGRVKLHDFGAAFSLGYTPQPEEVVFTDCYVAPEQCDPVPITEKIDVFGIGGLLYCGLAKKNFRELPPGFRDMPIAARTRILQQPVIPLRDRVQVSTQLDKLVTACLEREPGNRPTTVELSQETDAILKKGL